MLGYVQKKLRAIEGKLGGGEAISNRLSAVALLIAFASMAISLFQTHYVWDQTRSLRDQTYSDNIEKTETLIAEIQRVETSSLILNDWEQIVKDSILAEAKSTCVASPCELASSAKSIGRSKLTSALNSAEDPTPPQKLSRNAIARMAQAYNIRQYMITELDGKIFSGDLADALTRCGYVSADNRHNQDEEARWSGMQLASKAALQFVSALQSSEAVDKALSASGIDPSGSTALGSLGSALDSLRRSLCGLGKIYDLSKGNQPGQSCREDFEVVSGVADFLVGKLEEVRAVCQNKRGDELTDLHARARIRSDSGGTNYDK